MSAGRTRHGEGCGIQADNSSRGRISVDSSGPVGGGESEVWESGVRELGVRKSGSREGDANFRVGCNEW